MGPTPEDLSVTGFGRWFSASAVKKIAGWLMSSAGGIAFQSLVDAMSSVWKIDDLSLPIGRILFADTP
jgi:hypothetical protein